MSGPTSIEEALATLPASETSFTVPHIPLGGRKIEIKNRKHPESTTPKPKLQPWLPTPTHFLINPNHHNRGLTRISKVKPSFNFAGISPPCKQSIKFNSALPLPFLEQNGPHDEYLAVEDTDEPAASHDDTGGAGLTASDLELDLESDGSSNGEGAGMSAQFLEDSDDEANSKPAPRPPKRQRIASFHDTPEDGQTSLPPDFLELLRIQVPGGRKEVSPGDFARVWKLSGRKIGNDMVLAQNEYFSSTSEKASGKAETKRAKGKARG
ncbi:hypothetical protein TWF696_003291 [Orbilia brochopaga]|uniref:Uncharacterized protein n=1 Tax=Orbilia brochopaga TaxID=3140254 RepID=A0AAV9U0G6_9PEZI